MLNKHNTVFSSNMSVIRNMCFPGPTRVLNACKRYLYRFQSFCRAY